MVYKKVKTVKIFQKMQSVLPIKKFCPHGTGLQLDGFTFYFIFKNFLKIC